MAAPWFCTAAILTLTADASIEICSEPRTSALTESAPVTKELATEALVEETVAATPVSVALAVESAPLAVVALVAGAVVGTTWGEVESLTVVEVAEEEGTL